jgi:transcription elongation factor Elf1
VIKDHDFDGSRSRSYSCPSCNNNLAVSKAMCNYDYITGKAFAYMHYCITCGQKLDWSEVE